MSESQSSKSAPETQVLSAPPRVSGTAITAYDLLTVVREVILEEPQRYAQHAWVILLNPSVNKKAPSCGTVCCVAGWVQTLITSRTNEEKRLKAILQKTLFHTRSWTEIETFTPERLETARAVMLHFEAAAPQINLRDEAAVIDLIQSCADLERETAAIVGMT